MTADRGGSGQAWPTLGGDPGREGRTGGPAGPVDGVRRRFRVPVADGGVSPPAVVDGAVYAGTDDGTVVSVDATTGQRHWEVDVGAPVERSPAVADGTVFVGAADGTVHALSAADGTDLWSRSLDAGEVYAPAVVEDAVVVTTRGGTVASLAATTGDPLWTEAIGGHVHHAPTVAEERVYAGSRYSSVLCAVGLSTGERIWEAPYAPATTLAAADDCLFLGTTAETVYALTVEDDTTYPVTERWSYSTGGTLSILLGSTVGGSPAVGDGTVYFGCANGVVYALSTADGDREWYFEADGPVQSAPVVADGATYLGSDSGTVYAVDAESGQALWSYAADEGVSSPAVADGALFFGCGDGALYALE